MPKPRLATLTVLVLWTYFSITGCTTRSAITVWDPPIKVGMSTQELDEAVKNHHGLLTTHPHAKLMKTTRSPGLESRIYSVTSTHFASVGQEAMYVDIDLVSNRVVEINRTWTQESERLTTAE